MDRLLKHANSGDVVLYRRPLEHKISSVWNASQESLAIAAHQANVENLCDFEFVAPNLVSWFFLET